MVLMGYLGYLFYFVFTHFVKLFKRVVHGAFDTNYYGLKKISNLPIFHPLS